MNATLKKMFMVSCAAIMTLATFCLASCKEKEPEQPTVEEPTKYVDPFEVNLPQVPDGYFYRELPKSYEKDCATAGTLEIVDYNSFNLEGEVVEDHAYVYLPNGYDQNDKSKKYNVFYMSHGGGGDYFTMFYRGPDYINGKKRPTIFKNVLDNMIANKDIEPMIVVAPTYTLSSTEYYQQHCFVQCLLPAIEGKYNTYAESTDEAGLKASRAHRAFGGYSMGSANCWYNFQYNLEYVKWFMPLSGTHWSYISDLRPEVCVEVCDMLEQLVKDKGYTNRDFFIYSSTGTQDLDSAYEGVSTFFAELSKHDGFVYTNDFKTGNIHLDFSQKNLHNDVPYGVYYIYNTLPHFFQEY